MAEEASDSWRKPGRAFRARLLKEDEEEGGSTFVLSSTCSISKYFDVADRVLDQFLQHPIDSKEDLVEAYLVGNRLCRFLSNVLPTHPDYWSSDRAVASFRNKSHSQLVELMYFVKQLAVMIDEDEHQEYISRVLDSSSMADNSSRAVIADQFPKHVSENGALPGIIVESNHETDSESDATDFVNLEDSAENFDTMWAKVATDADNRGNVRRRPMKNPNMYGTGSELAEEKAVDEPDWASFSDDMSWTRMSLSVSSSKFQIESPQRKGDIQPPQVVQSKKKKKKSRSKPQLTPIVDIEDSFDYGTTLEERLRQGKRDIQNVQTFDDDYPPPPESDYYGQGVSPPRESFSDSPTSVREEWSSTWDSSEPWRTSSAKVGTDGTKVRLIPNSGKSPRSDRDISRRDYEGKSCLGITRRQRALRGLICVKSSIK
jgi:hypothetical protein